MIYLILAFGFFLRLISLNQSLWLDEATSANAANMGLAKLLAVFSPGDFHPPLYYLFLNFWTNLFGSSEIVLRFPSIIAAVGTIYVLYLIGKELVDKKVGVVAALLLGTSGLHLYYSQEARMYSLAAFFVSLTFLFFVKIIKKGRVGEWFLFSFFLALSILTDYLPVLIIPAFWIFAWREKLKTDWRKKLFTSHIILLGISLTWLPYFLKQLSAGLSVRSHSPFWWQILGQANFKQFILIPTKFIFGRINMDVDPVQILIVAVAFLIFGLFLVVSLRNRQKTKLVWLWLVIPLVLAALISFWIPTLSYFRFLFVLPAFYLLIAAGVLKLPKLVSKLAVFLLVIFNLVTSSVYLLNKENQREDWRGLAKFIKEESQARRAAVVFVADSQQEAYRYYDKDVKIATSDEIDKSYDLLWLMRYVQEVFDPEDKTRLEIEALGYNKAQEYNFNGVIVWKYEK